MTMGDQALPQKFIIEDIVDPRDDGEHFGRDVYV